MHLLPMLVLSSQLLQFSDVGHNGSLCFSGLFSQKDHLLSVVRDVSHTFYIQDEGNFLVDAVCLRIRVQAGLQVRNFPLDFFAVHNLVQQVPAQSCWKRCTCRSLSCWLEPANRCLSIGVDLTGCSRATFSWYNLATWSCKTSTSLSSFFHSCFAFSEILLQASKLASKWLLLHNWEPGRRQCVPRSFQQVVRLLEDQTSHHCVDDHQAQDLCMGAPSLGID